MSDTVTYDLVFKHHLNDDLTADIWIVSTLSFYEFVSSKCV